MLQPRLRAQAVHAGVFGRGSSRKLLSATSRRATTARAKSIEKNSLRGIKPLSCLDKLRFSCEVRVVESIA